MRIYTLILLSVISACFHQCRENKGSLDQAVNIGFYQQAILANVLSINEEINAIEKQIALSQLSSKSDDNKVKKRMLLDLVEHYKTFAYGYESIVRNSFPDYTPIIFEYDSTSLLFDHSALENPKIYIPDDIDFKTIILELRNFTFDFTFSLKDIFLNIPSPPYPSTTIKYFKENLDDLEQRFKPFLYYVDTSSTEITCSNSRDFLHYAMTSFLLTTQFCYNLAKEITLPRYDKAYIYIIRCKPLYWNILI